MLTNDEKFVTDGEILTNLLITNKLKNTDIANALGVSRQQAGKYKNSKTISVDIKEKLKELLDLDIDAYRNNNVYKNNAQPFMAQEPFSPYMHSTIQNNVIYVPCKAYAGWANGETNPVTNRDLQVFTLPFLPYMAYLFDVDGESMRRTLRNGERVFVERESLRDYSVFANKVHVIELKDGTYMVKRVSKISKDEIRIQSDNPDWKDKQDIYNLYTDVSRIWKVKNALKWDLGFMEDMEGLDMGVEEAALRLDQKG